MLIIIINLVNWNILVAKKKINKDFVSNGEWKWKRMKKIIKFFE